MINITSRFYHYQNYTCVLTECADCHNLNLNDFFLFMKRTFKIAIKIKLISWCEICRSLLTNIEIYCNFNTG